MNLSSLKNSSDKYKVGFALAVGEIVFGHIDKNDEKYCAGREALDRCWKCIESEEVLGDALYELIDNPECVGISEYAEEEENINFSKLWYLLVDIVAYTAWIEYKKENVSCLPQALESIKDDSIVAIIESAVDTAFITEEEIEKIYNQILANLNIEGNKIKKELFMSN